MGVKFIISGKDQKLEELKVQFKEWATADVDQPYCTVKFNDPDTQRQHGKRQCYWTDGDGFTEGSPVYSVQAMVGDAYSDEEPPRPLNVSMLQAIHIELLEPRDATKKFCLTEVWAITNRDAIRSRTFKGDDVPKACETPELIPVRDSDGEWLKPLAEDTDVGEDWGDAGPFEIMKEEVSVGEYVECMEADGGCGEEMLDWKSCNVAEYRKNRADRELAEQAANCITWCQADRDRREHLGGRPGRCLQYREQQQVLSDCF